MCRWLFEGLVERENELRPAGAQCVDAFWSEAKHNNFAKTLDLDLTRETMDHLMWFIHNNEQLMYLTLRSRELDLLQQCTESLSGNQRLVKLRFVQVDFSMRDVFDKLLCDATTLESIASSNHVLEQIELWRHNAQPEFKPRMPCVLSRMAKQCLLLNYNHRANHNKAQVIRNKILRFYFVGEFNVDPFATIALSVLPEVMSRIHQENRLSAMFRLLQCIPELRKVSER